jgi:thiol-disulfide isomerase/thioredoxin
MVTEISMHDVDTILTSAQENKRVTVIMFYGETCGPCKATMPFYEQTSEFFQDVGAKFDFYRINAWNPPDQYEYCKTMWGIKGVPQFKIFYNYAVLIDRAGGGDFETLKSAFMEAVDTVFKQYGDKV